MVLAFLSLVILNGLAGVLVWLAWGRISEHLRNNPEAAKLLAEVIASLLSGKKPEQKE